MDRQKSLRKAPFSVLIVVLTNRFLSGQSIGDASCERRVGGDSPLRLCGCKELSSNDTKRGAACPSALRITGKRNCVATNKECYGEVGIDVASSPARRRSGDAGAGGDGGLPRSTWVNSPACRKTTPLTFSSRLLTTTVPSRQTTSVDSESARRPN